MFDCSPACAGGASWRIWRRDGERRRLAQRARILLLAAEGAENNDISLRVDGAARDKSSGGRTTIRGMDPILFAARDAATGKIIGRCYPRNGERECLSFLCEIERNVGPISTFA
jgi:hypothetical protein